MTRINWDRARVQYVKRERPMRVTIRARFGSTCHKCGERIHVGDPIASMLDVGSRHYAHEECIYGPRRPRQS